MGAVSIHLKDILLSFRTVGANAVSIGLCLRNCGCICNCTHSNTTLAYLKKQKNENSTFEEKFLWAAGAGGGVHLAGACIMDEMS